MPETRHLPTRAGVGVGIGALTVLATSCCRSPEPAPSAASMVTQLSPDPFGPITFYQAQCARCHGTGGVRYGEAFLSLSDNALRHTVHAMVEGFTPLDLDDTQIEALTAWHRSMMDDLPFLVVTGVADDRLTGEVTPGSIVVLRADGVERAASVDGHRWSAPRRDPMRPCDIVASAGASTTTLRWPAEQRSHGRPDEGGASRQPR